MSENRDYAVRIEVEGEFFRFGTDRLIISETLGGETASFNYLPFIVELDELTEEVGLDSDSPVPTFDVTVWDAIRQVMDELQELDYESAPVTIFMVEDEEVVGKFAGYMTDVGFREGQMSFTVRSDEDAPNESFLTEFTPYTFQYTDVFSVKDANLVAGWEREENCPWTVATAIERVEKYDGQSRDLKIVHPDGSGGWDSERFSGSTTFGLEADVVLDDASEIHVVHRNYPGEIWYTWRDSLGSWHTEGTGLTGFDPSIEVVGSGSNRTVYIAYRGQVVSDAYNDGINVDSKRTANLGIRNSSGSWSFEVIQENGWNTDVGVSPDISRDGSNLFITYIDIENQQVRMAYKLHGSSTQSPSTVATDSHRAVSALDSGGNPWVLFMGTTAQGLKLAKHDGVSWSVSSVPTPESGIRDISLDVDTYQNKDHAYIAFGVLYGNEGVYSGTDESGSWVFEDIQDNGSPLGVDIVAMGINNPRVAYLDTSKDDGTLMFAERIGGTWNVSSVARLGYYFEVGDISPRRDFGLVMDGATPYIAAYAKVGEPYTDKVPVPAVTERFARLGHDYSAGGAKGIHLDGNLNDMHFFEFEFDPLEGDDGRLIATRVDALTPINSTPSDNKCLFDEMGGYVAIGHPGAANYEVVEYKKVGFLVDVFGTSAADQLGDDHDMTLYNSASGNGNGLVAWSVIDLNYNHKKGEPVRLLYGQGVEAPDYTFDILYVNSYSWVPHGQGGFEDQPELTAGFVDIGLDIDRQITMPDGSSVDVTAIHRYKMALQGEEGYPGDTSDILGLQMHTHTEDDLTVDSGSGYLGLLPDTDHAWHVKFFPSQFAMSKSVDSDTPVKFVGFQWQLASMDVFVENAGGRDLIAGTLTFEEFKASLPSFKNRMRGCRVDMLKAYTDIIVSRRSLYNSTEWSEVNQAFLNEASGLYATCTSSGIEYDDTTCAFFERLKFSYNDDYGKPEEALGNMLSDASADPNPVTDYNQRVENLFTNMLLFKSRSGLAFQSDDMGIEEAKTYFASKKYRVIRDPVPENSKDLGKIFPIVYGHVRQVPLIHTMGKKVAAGKKWTAGDDVYIYASHPCDVKTPYDIQLYIEDTESEEPRTKDDFGMSLGKHVIDSPFPNQINNHYEKEGETVRYVGTLNHPYHQIDTFRTSEGISLQGIKLRGGEWNPELGSLDKRYPIRYGVGSSTLYGSYSGWVDTNQMYTERGGAVITHPCDIINHYIDHYGEYPFNSEMIDRESIERVKAKTRKYEAAVYIEEEMSPSVLIPKLCRQLGILWYLYGSGLRFKTSDFRIEEVKWNKPLSHNLNLLNKVEEDDRGYRDLYNKVIYNYQKNWMDGGFDKRITLDSSNNEYCRNADKAKGNRRTLTVDADFVNSSYVANHVVRRLAKINSSRKIFYSCSAKYVDGIRFEPGDIVPMTYPPYNMSNEPVFIKSVKPGQSKMDLEVVRFPDLI